PAERIGRLCMRHCLAFASPRILPFGESGFICFYARHFVSLAPSWILRPGKPNEIRFCGRLFVSLPIAMKRIAYLTFCALALAAGACSQNAASTEEETADEPQNILYGINADNYRTESAEIRSGETLGKILGSYGVSAAAIDRLDK